MVASSFDVCGSSRPRKGGTVRVGFEMRNAFGRTRERISLSFAKNLPLSQTFIHPDTEPFLISLMLDMQAFNARFGL